jgi:hypothetical protein
MIHCRKSLYFIYSHWRYLQNFCHLVHSRMANHPFCLCAKSGAGTQLLLSALRVVLFYLFIYSLQLRLSSYSFLVWNQVGVWVILRNISQISLLQHHLAQLTCASSLYVFPTGHPELELQREHGRPTCLPCPTATSSFLPFLESPNLKTSKLVE